MEEVKIQLNNDPAIIRELYFIKGLRNVINNNFTRKPLQLTAATVLATIIIYLLAFLNGNISWLLLVMLVILLCVLSYTIIMITEYLKWRTQVNDYIKQVSAFTSWNVILSDTVVEVDMGTEIQIEKWESISSVYIAENYIQLDTVQHKPIILPRKSMSLSEFENVISIIKAKVSVKTD